MRLYVMTNVDSDTRRHVASTLRANYGVSIHSVWSTSYALLPPSGLPYFIICISSAFGRAIFAETVSNGNTPSAAVGGDRRMHEDFSARQPRN